MKYLPSLFALALFVSPASADDDEERTRVPVSYEIAGLEFRGALIYALPEEDDDAVEPLPGIVMFPNWMGPTESAYEKAEMIADEDFAVFVADMYGTRVRPADSAEASEAAGVVRADREMMRQRANKAVQVFHRLAGEHPIDTDKTIAIGFCFGGGTVLELARSGIDSIDGVVSFHGDLMSPTLREDADEIEVPVLVLHGAEDPYVPQEDVRAFVQAMQDGEVEDWALVQFGGAVHSFTDPEADSEGARYHERTAERAFEMMEDFAEEWMELDE